MSWRALEEEIARWREAGRAIEFWWRDDDAAGPTAPVRQLLDLSAKSGVPLALAVIPLAVEAELFDGIQARVLMHGTDHRNRAAAQDKKTEFPPTETDASLTSRLAAARERLASLAGAAFLPVLAPPWNRFERPLAPVLASGLTGFSGYGVRKNSHPAPGMTQVNTHVDLIDWRGARRFCGEDAALAAATRHLAARRTGDADAREPTGWLTHHELHDPSAWRFLERLFERTRRLDVRWRDAASLFAAGT